MIDAKTLDKLAWLDKLATPGPWEMEKAGRTREDCHARVEADPRGVLFDTLNAGSVVTIYGPELDEDGYGPWYVEGEAADNLRLCVTARNALPSLIAAARNLEALLTPRAYDEWHDDDGAVLWWLLPLGSPPYVGDPTCSDWPFSANDEDNVVWTPLPNGNVISERGGKRLGSDG